MILEPEESYPHGSIDRYNKARCRCPECRAANAAYFRARLAERRASGAAARQPHGTTSTYTKIPLPLARHIAKAWYPKDR